MTDEKDKKTETGAVVNAPKNDNRMGNRMIAAGLITDEQRDFLVKKQKECQEKGDDIRFGELAVREGFCTEEDVESLPGYIGERLVEAGLITDEQQLILLGLQSQLRKEGKKVRYGALAVEKGYCTQEEIDMLAMLLDIGAIE